MTAEKKNKLSKDHINQLIKSKAKELGFFACAVSKAEFFEEDVKRLESWLKKGFHGEMGYMKNHFGKRTDPSKLFENAKSIISVLYNYYPKTVISEENNYKISKYAYGKDYHFVMKKKMKKLIDFLHEVTGEVNSRAFVDSAPMLDRAWAARAGLGWIGKNTNLITKKHGSYFFIGEIITDLELEYNEYRVPDHCGTCSRCIDACPTSALKPYELDARKCISYLTIENKDEITPHIFKGKLNDWIFGCDICQDVCPWNRFSKSHNEPEFEPSAELLKMRKPDWENLSEKQFDRIFKDSPVKRTKYKGLIRNILFQKSG